MGGMTAAALFALGFLVLSVIWWLMNGAARERRRTKAEAWARTQVSVQAVGIGDDMGKHHFEGTDATTVPPLRSRTPDGAQDRTVTVPDLLKRAVQAGDPLRLNWPDSDADEPSLVRPYAQDDFPTGVLPKITCSEASAAAAGTTASLTTKEGLSCRLPIYPPTSNETALCE
jgi:hypothetical protein